VKRITATVTQPGKSTTPPATNGNGSNTTAMPLAKPKTIYTVGPVELPSGTEDWSPELHLAEGENTITVTDADHANVSASVKVISHAGSSADDREDFEATFYAGASIDSFASNETKQYIGYTSADSGPKTGYAVGFDFAYRLPFKRNPASTWPVQLWLFG